MSACTNDCRQGRDCTCETAPLAHGYGICQHTTMSCEEATQEAARMGGGNMWFVGDKSDDLVTGLYWWISAFAAFVMGVIGYAWVRWTV